MGRVTQVTVCLHRQTDKLFVLLSSHATAHNTQNAIINHAISSTIFSLELLVIGHGTRSTDTQTEFQEHT